MSERKSFWAHCLHAKHQCLKYLATIVALVLSILGAGVGAGRLRAQTISETGQSDAIITASKSAAVQVEKLPSEILTSQVIAPADFQFASEKLIIHKISDGGSSSIAKGVESTGRPWIQSALGSLGFTDSEIDDHLAHEGGLYIMGSLEIDRYLAEARRGSWGTTLFVKQKDEVILIPAFHSVKFTESPNGDQILMWTAVEEAVQSPLYANMFALQRENPEEFARWGYSGELSLVESLSDGGMRAFFEYAQHEAIVLANPNWRNVSYDFLVGDSVARSLDEVRPEVIGLVNSVLDKNFTKVEEILPYFGDKQKLFALNVEFRKWSKERFGQERNIWDAFGLSRRGKEINQPLVNL